MFEVAVPLVAAGMGGDQLLVMVNAEPVGKGLEDQPLGGVTARHRIAIGLQPDPEAVVGPHGVGDARVGRQRG